MSKPIKIPKKYKPLFDQSHGKRYIIITGGRGSGKSFAVSAFICRDIWGAPGKRVLYTRYTMASAEISIIPEFTEKIELLGGLDFFDVKTKDITCTVTGSDILFRGIKTSSGNQTAKLKSIQGVSTFVIDEAEEMVDEASFDKIDLSIRTSNAKNSVILILNPTTKEHWIYKRWFENYLDYIEIDGQQIPVSNHPDVIHIHTTYLDNLQHLDKSFLSQVERIKRDNPDKYRNLILGGWLERAEGVVFTNWTTGAFDQSLPHCYGLDFGYSPDPTALVRVAIDNKHKILYLDECLYANELSVDQLIESVRGSIKSQRDLIVCDTNEKRTVAAMAKARLNVSKALKYPGSVIDGIRDMQDYRMIVTPDSKNLIKELNNYVWNDKKASIPVDEYNHCFTGDTLVTTIQGVKQIKNVTTSDRVLTTKGFKPVLARFNNGVKKVIEYRMQFDMFCVYLHCTFDHKIKTQRGWIQISQLRSGDVIYLHKDSLVKITDYTKASDILAEGQNDCIELCGSITKVKSQKGTTYTTLTEIRLTTALRTLRSSIENCTVGLKGSEGIKKTLNGARSLLKRVSKQLSSGTNQKKGLSGIDSMLKNKVLAIRHTVKEVAKFAAMLIQPKLQSKNSAQTSANRNTEETPNSITLKKPALYAQTNSLQASIHGQKLVAIHALQSYNTDVYDLHIEDQHEYLANGVLVHNCCDAARYASQRLSLKYNKRKK